MKEKCDILHCTSNTAPNKINIPLIVTLHDIIYMEKSYFGILTDKGTSYQKFGNVYRRWYVPKIVKNCDILITVSNFEKKRISDFFQLKENKLHAIYNGVSRHFKQVTVQSELSRVKSQYKLPDDFFFFLGNTDPKKNTKGVLKAYSDFRKKSTDDYKLVMLDYDEEELMKLLAEIGDKALREHIILTGYVINTDLPAIYSLCNIFLYPSLRESFGIPMLEAMRCGVPVITSNTSSMPEVSGDGALFVDPYKPAEITEAIFKIQGDNEFRDILIEKGLKRSEKFSWKNMAIDVLKLYENFA
jgi:glycosyltransferase involved in cell wall biosynthesis